VQSITDLNVIKECKVQIKEIEEEMGVQSEIAKRGDEDQEMTEADNATASSTLDALTIFKNSISALKSIKLDN